MKNGLVSASTTITLVVMSLKATPWDNGDELLR